SGDRELRRQIRHETLHNWFDGPTYNGIHRSAHSGIAKKGRATGKNLFVGCLHVSVGAENGGNFAIKKPGERDFLTRRFAMNINHDDRSFRAHFRDRPFHRVKWILQDGEHEGAALHVDHAHFSFSSLQEDRSVPWSAFRIINRPEQAWLGVDEAEDHLLVPDTIACGTDR